MKIALVTGASHGIGSAIAKALVQKNYFVIINYNKSKKQAEDLQKELKNAEIYKADVSKKEEVNKMVQYILQKYKKIDVLVNNAGISQIKPFADVTEDDWDAMINTNLKSVYLVTKAVISNMIQNQNGAIVNISSIWGTDGASCEVSYSASKAGVIGFTKALAKEMALSNITVNAVAPGMIDTSMNRNELTLSEIKEIENEIPLGRMGTPEEVANAVIFLIENKYITGQIIGVNGGWSI